MTAYLICHITVRYPEKWREYRSKVPATLAASGGELVLGGGKVAVLSGEHSHTDTVVLRFPDVAVVKRWYDSAAYRRRFRCATRLPKWC